MLQAIKRIVFSSLLGLFVVSFSACTTEHPDIGHNGNGALSDLKVENCNLIPVYNPKVTNYMVVRSTNAVFKMLVTPFNYKTKYLINGSFVKMETNGMGYPIPTDITALMTNNKVVVDTQAADGTKIKYTLDFVGTEYDASLTGLSTSSGSLFPSFDEGRAPDYNDRITTRITNNMFEVVVANSNFQVTSIKQQANAKLYFNGFPSEYGAGLSSVVTTLTLQNSSWSNVPVALVSQNGAITNNKILKVRYILPNEDTRLTDITINGGAVKFLPDFYFFSYDYNLTLEDVNSINISFTKQNANAKVFIVKSNEASTLVTQINSGAEIGAGITTATATSIPAIINDKVTLRVESASGSVTNFYNIKIMSFTTINNYDFVGGIKNFLDRVKVEGEITTPGTVTGVITIRDYWGYRDALNCFFLQDAQSGLYVFSGLNAIDMALPSQFRVGHKVKVTFNRSKVYYGMAEAIQFASIEFADGGTDPKTQPLYPIYLNTGPFTFDLALGKIWKYRGTVYSELDSHKDGSFGGTALFQVNEPAQVAELGPKYLKKGMTHTWYGPILWDWGKYKLRIVNSVYMLAE